MHLMRHSKICLTINCAICCLFILCNLLVISFEETNLKIPLSKALCLISMALQLLICKPNKAPEIQKTPKTQKRGMKESQLN